ncbi:PREDICTED: tetratricopeptide repeat protein 8-like [Amphimedon queenslandica]|uniref:Uncharacterized protein n=1 Tax=Amphimedon queenslandica TaxID=400682 RepID=A0A1X7VLN5_AMPQE|nr:PREDICTED: tetratricopeptide repeat protein 8-like [Amphimedon queenslandica]|eukprot:XP_003383822.3 PREDICTED: tetratricopeptide repeat protein 8-like [Amphimedon queenslandica]
MAARREGGNFQSGVDPLFMALTLFRHRRFGDCLDICNQLLEKNPRDQAVWFLKVRSLTEQTYIDETEVEDEGIAELTMDDNKIADVARPGTSLRQPTAVATGRIGTSQGVRPVSQVGRPVSGFLRPGTQMGGGGTSLEQAIKAPRTAQTARPITSSSGRFIRLGTASMLTEPGGSFIDVTKLNLATYAQKPALAKVLFEYLFHHESNFRSALQLAAHATESCRFEDWWWKVQLGKCYYRLGLYRDAEGQYLSALRSNKVPHPITKGTTEYFHCIDMYLYLCKLYIKLDQPLKALEYYRKGLEKFPKDTSLLIGMARIYEGLSDTDQSIQHYREALQSDSTCVEAIACIATNYFYSDQPEIALSYYRRLLQMGVYNAELFNNLGLCCYYAQQYDFSLSCFQKSLSLASLETLADIWYNIGQLAVGTGDTKLAYQCFKLAITHDNNHAEAYNNLGVLEWQNKKGEKSLACYNVSVQLAPHLYEPHYNIALASQKIGCLHKSYKAVKKSLEVYPDHIESQELLKQIQQHFEAL